MFRKLQIVKFFAIRSLIWIYNVCKLRQQLTIIVSTESSIEQTHENEK